MESNHPTVGLPRPAGFEDQRAVIFETEDVQRIRLRSTSPRDRFATAFWEFWEPPTRARVPVRPRLCRLGQVQTASAASQSSTACLSARFPTDPEPRARHAKATDRYVT